MISKAKFDAIDCDKKTGRHTTICFQGFDNNVYLQPFSYCHIRMYYQFISNKRRVLRADIQY